MNLPNKLTVARIALVPVFMIVMALPETLLPFSVVSIIGAALFIIISLTDMLDGKIARKYNLITDFGKFLDPLADKFLVIGAMLMILYRFDNLRPVFIWVFTVVVFRELAVTSARLVASTKGGIVIAANMLGKIKTVSQITAIVAILIEPLLYPDAWELFGIKLTSLLPLSYISMIFMAIMTLISGINYLIACGKYIDVNK